MAGYGNGGLYGAGPGIFKKVGLWVPTIPGSTVFGGGAAAPGAANLFAYSPFIPGFDFSTNLMWFEFSVAGALGTTMDIGIYSSGPDGLPNTLMSSVVNVPADATVEKQVAVNVTFARGAIYWIAAVSNGVAALFGTSNQLDVAISNPSANAGNGALTNAHAYGTLPISWPYSNGTSWLSGAPLYKFQVTG